MLESLSNSWITIAIITNRMQPKAYATLCRCDVVILDLCLVLKALFGPNAKSCHKGHMKFTKLMNVSLDLPLNCNHM